MLRKIKERLFGLMVRLGLLRPGKIMYIGGSDTLPPPLQREEEARLLELLSQAETMTDLLEIEARLSEVRSELENYASQKRLYDNQIDYATIYIAIEEVQEYTPTEEPSLWERIRDGFKDNLEGVGEGLLDVLVWFIVSIPTLVVLAVVVLILVLIVRRIRRRRKAKKTAKQQKTEE